MENRYSEKEMYPGMCIWLQRYLEDKYRNRYEIIVRDTSTRYLDDVLREVGVNHNKANGLQIQIDVLGIAKRSETDYKLFIIEAKKGVLNLKDLGQLWAYTKLIDPEESYLIGGSGLGHLGIILNVLRRLDLLQYGDGKKSKYIKVGLWDMNRSQIIQESIVPRT